MNEMEDLVAELEAEVARLNLEVVQNQSGARVILDAGVAYAEEVKRLERVIAALRQIHFEEDYLINPVITPPTRHRGCFTCKSDGPCATMRVLEANAFQ
jgi:hypothetical protein